jgi:excisionase family DNA binding protein/putative nucleotidyltransferase with HDIG domain
MITRSRDISSKEIMSSREAAKLLRVTTQTIKNYIYSGKLKAIKTPGGHHRIRMNDLKTFGFVAENERNPDNFSMAELLNKCNDLVGTLVTTVQSLVRALDTRDIVSSGHSLRVADLSCNLGRTMSLSDKDIQELKLGALLHDVGKVGISEAILGKPGRLTDQEFFLIKKHSEIGEKIVSEIEYLMPVASCVRHHHERYDGKGYPDGIGGSDIELNSRIIAVADTYDFLRSDLYFRKAFSVNDSLQEIRNSSGTQFDPEIIRNLIENTKENKYQFN